MKKSMLFIIILIFIFIPIMIISQMNEPPKKRYAIFVNRKGNAELGAIRQTRIYYTSEIESRAMIGGNNVVLVKNDSKGDILFIEGEIYIFENTTFVLDIFNTAKMLFSLLHGVIEVNLSNMPGDYLITGQTPVLNVKSIENTFYRLEYDRKAKWSTIDVLGGWVKVYSALKRNECIILEEGQGIKMLEGQLLSDIILPDGVDLLINCDTEYETMAKYYNIKIETQIFESEGHAIPETTETEHYSPLTEREYAFSPAYASSNWKYVFKKKIYQNNTYEENIIETGFFTTSITSSGTMIATFENENNNSINLAPTTLNIYDYYGHPIAIFDSFGKDIKNNTYSINGTFTGKYKNLTGEIKINNNEIIEWSATREEYE